ncbi:Hypothetical predicted protein [Mytilus galloprovincialis]|uniref:Tyrosine-protein kinase ephrin type A/B receptor-like domain-containing protein n=1 Tax=Mytilus galloprovincialis TaxID=29158 RepID=A0A8B6HE51_MYTGA|nr:Hypothetical predicted protein [Mytilus galloprovincialis]
MTTHPLHVKGQSAKEFYDRAGKYCGSYGLTAETGDCDPGYYCPEGQTVATPANYSCPLGYFCVGGKELPEPCASGTYQDEPIQSTCKTCPAGFYCNATFGPVINYATYICPEGFFCPDGTRYPEEFPCPEGTFNNRTGLNSTSECSECVGGMACDVEGLTYPIRPCSAGYFCRQSADSTTPSLGSLADQCPAGSYCPVETAEPIGCPEGSYSSAMALQMESQCINCTGGLTAVFGQCLPGFYCPVGSKVSTEIICTAGAYCPIGTENPVPCPAGKYSDVGGLRYYCPNGSSVETQIICPAAMHCPTGSATPQECPAGMFVDYDGAAACSVCPEGYYCVPELSIEGNSASAKNICPMGFFCPNGTGHDWQPCPAGTYGLSQGLKKAEDLDSMYRRTIL